MERHVMKRKRLHITNRIKGIAGCILLATGFALLFISRLSQEFAHWYSTKVYPVWVGTTGRLMNLFPFSVSEVFLYIMIVIILLSAGVLIIKEVRRKAGKKEACSWGMGLFLLAAFLFFLYVLNCGVNYHRESFSESSGLQVENYTAGDLKEVCQWLTLKVNETSSEVERDQDGVMVLDISMEKYAAEAMRGLGEDYPELAGYYPRPKGLLVPWILSIQNLTGVYSPFTVEANYNSGMTDYNIPFTACHELSHLRGFMQEEEANFIAYLACSRSDNVQFRYSGNLLGWIYCMSVLHTVDYDAWEEVRQTLAPEVEPDLAANREYWARYDGAVAEVSNKVNDTYLKANGQDDGVKSYDRMVDLIVAYYLKVIIRRQEFATMQSIGLMVGGVATDVRFSLKQITRKSGIGMMRRRNGDVSCQSEIRRRGSGRKRKIRI